MEGHEASVSVFLHLLSKRVHDWAGVWQTWRDTRPPPERGVRSYCPFRVPREAQTFIEHFGLLGTYDEWATRTADNPADQAQPGRRRLREDTRRDDADPPRTRRRG